MAEITPDVVEEMSGDMQRLFPLPAPELITRRRAQVECESDRIYGIAVQPETSSNATSLIDINLGYTYYVAHVSPNKRYLFILRPRQSIELRCGPMEGTNCGAAIVFVLSVNYGFNYLIPVRRNTRNTLIATAGPPIGLRVFEPDLEEFPPTQRVAFPNDSNVTLSLEPNVEYEISVDVKDPNRSRRLPDPTTLITLQVTGEEA